MKLNCRNNPIDALLTYPDDALAMPSRAPGALIGKAMTELAAGKGLVLVLVNLQ